VRGYVERVGRGGFVPSSDGVEDGCSELVRGAEEGADVFGGLGLEDGDAEVSAGVGEFTGGGGGGD